MKKQVSKRTQCSLSFVHSFKNPLTQLESGTGYKMLFIFLHHFFSKKNLLFWQYSVSYIQDVHTSTRWPSYKLWITSVKSGMWWQILAKLSKIKFHKNSFSNYWIPAYIHIATVKITGTFLQLLIVNRLEDKMSWFSSQKCAKADFGNCMSKKPVESQNICFPHSNSQH